MSTTLERLGSGEAKDIALALFNALERRPESEQQAAMVLAVAVSCTQEQLRQVCEIVWGGDWDTADVAHFAAGPLVEVVRGRLRLAEPLDRYVAQLFALEHGEQFDAAHAAFAAIEEETASGEIADALTNWECKARLAYYLLPLDPSRSMAEFAHRFDESPVAQRRSCRLWLASLSSRYSGIVSGESRLSRFFEGFEAYVADDRAGALSILAPLLEDQNDDEIAAISMHLVAGCLSRKSGRAARLQLLEQSVELSSKLGLSENLLMSRNSAVFDYLGEIARGVPGARERCVSLAEQNDQLAAELDEPVFRTVTLRALALARWNAAEIDQRPDLVDAVSGLLDQSAVQAEIAHDLSARVMASVAKCSIFRDIGDFDSALAALDDAALQVEMAVARPTLPTRQFRQEVDRLSEIESTPEAEVELATVAARFERACRRAMH